MPNNENSLSVAIMISLNHCYRLSATLIAGGLVAACASSPQLNAQWIDPSLGTHSSLLRGAKVLVACDAFDVAVRQVCQDQLASEVVARGATPVLVASDTPLLTDRAIDGQLLSSARTVAAKAVLVVTLTPAVTDVNSGPSFSIGGFGFGRSSAVGVGVSAPIGGARVTTGFSANGRVTDVATGRLVWTASAAAAPSADLNAQFAALSKIVLDAAEKAGLF